MLRYYARSLGIKVTKPSVLWGDNSSMIMSSTIPASQLKKKTAALAYHFVRQNYAAGVIDIREISGKQNYADPMTKAVPSSEFHGCFGEFMEN